MSVRKILFLLLFLACALSVSHAQACPTPFTLSGSKIANLWKEVTDNQWKSMLPKGWTDKGFHFYSQVKDRGPKQGINTPSDLESEIMKKVADQPEGHPNRRQIQLPIKNDRGDSLLVIYDYRGRNATCELVTFSF